MPTSDGKPPEGTSLPVKIWNQLFFTAGWVFGREYHDLNTRAFSRFFKRGDAFGLIVFYANQGFFTGLNQVPKYFGTCDDFRSAFAHQNVIGGDVGFALGAVQN